ncbi:CHAT domain-containing protein [uncultured Psychroserpens sp.]|uniref:CHAT domain-containing protein n=1 Tax=uncultured Psychroserpens sp. TaxID=255436 RepID=UPI00261E0511|nr:CHAT domain-containing protein [uncultured Psychroserpens sp.]
MSSIRFFSQDISLAFKNISKSTIDKIEKEQKFDSLLNVHKNNKNFDLLFVDTYELAKWYRGQGNLLKAIELNKRNMAQMDSVNYENITLYRRNLYSLGFYERRNQDLESALKTFKRLLKYKSPDKYAIQGSFQMAEIYFVIGQYHNSKEHYELSKTIANSLERNEYYVRNAIGIGQACKRINTAKSLKYGIKVLSNATAFVDSVNSDDNTNNDVRKRFVHTLYNQLGNIYIDRFDYDFTNGKINLEKALLIATELNDSTLLGKTYNDYGVLYLKDQSLEAKFYFEKALSYSPDPLMVSIINRNLSIHHLFFKNYDKALEHAQKTLAILVGEDISNIKSLPSKSGLSESKVKFQLISALIDKAHIWTELAEKNPNDKSYINEALKTFELADFLTEKARLESKEFKSKLFWRKTAAEIYVNATKVSFLSDNIEKAFYFIEKSKALLLLEDVSLKTSRNNSEIPENIIKQESKLKNQIAELERLAVSSNTDSIRRLLLGTKDKYNQFINALDIKYRFYYKTTKPADIIDLKTFTSNILDNNTAYIEYILDDKDGFGIIITKENTQLFKIKNFDQLKVNAQHYRQLIEQPFLDKVAIEQLNTVSYALYESLFPEQIRSLIEGKKLTILADYYLQNIPFESFQTSKTSKNYLIFQNEISYAYSLSFLNENNKLTRVNTNNLVGFAPVDFSNKLTSLPNTQLELNLIKDLFPSTVFLNKNATKNRFFHETNNAKIIHIASHADANDSISPWIAFYNSKVGLKDLYNFNNTPDLVVLSACNTSLGELNKGEGVMSLSRSFFNTGSHSVLPTLWEVNDKTTVQLLKSFYQNIQLGQNKSLALHNAKLDYLKTCAPNQSLPYFWASFVLIGDEGHLEIDNGIPNIYYYLFALVFLIIVFLILKRKK